jgi:hypothetical protein
MRSSRLGFHLLGATLSLALVVTGACVGDSTVIPPDAGDASVSDVGVDVTNDATGDVVDAPNEAAPPLCGAPGEMCCMAPLAPCNDGLSCSTSTPAKCLVSDAWAVGTYSTVTSSQFVTQLVIAHYDGTAWTLGVPVNTDFGIDSYEPIDIYANGTTVLVIANENDIGSEYWWDGVAWQVCQTGNSCVGPNPSSTSLWALTSVTNSGSVDYWIAGTSLMDRCPSGATSCQSVTTGITGSWGTGNFAGQTSQDLWYSVFDHVLHYNGTTWSAQTVADARTIAQVDVNDDLWVGDQQLHNYNGSTWSSAYLVDGAQTPGLIFSISGSAANSVFATGNTNNAGSFMAYWNGTTWSMQTLPTGISGVQKVWAPSPIEAFTVGAKAPSANSGVIAHWNGTAWTAMPSPTVSYPGETQTGGLTWISVHGRARPRWTLSP